MTTTETITWYPSSNPPDDDTTVLIETDDESAPIWPGYRCGDEWFFADGMPAELSDIDAIAHRIAYRIIKAGVSTHSGIFSTVRLSLTIERIKKRIEWIDISQQKPPDYIPVRIKLSTGTELTGQRLNASWHFAEAVSPADEDATVTHWQAMQAGKDGEA